MTVDVNQRLTNRTFGRLSNADDMVGKGMIISSKPALALDFTSGNQTLDSRVTFTRSSAATRTNAQRLIETVSTDQPRFDYDYDPITLQPKGLLIEEQRTNLLTYSEQFDNAVWSKTNSTVTANTVVAPDGTLTADKLVEDTQTGVHFVESYGSVPASTTYVCSFYAKAGERGRVRANSGRSADVTDNGISDFDLTSGTVVSNANGLARIQSVGNGWYRCSIVAASNANVTNRFLTISLINSGGTYNYTGDGTSGIYIWGAQLEAGSFPTSYIPTTSAQATRAADVATMTGTNFSSWYNQSEGTLFAEWSVKDAVVGNRGPWWINNGAILRGIGVYHASSTVLRLMYRDLTAALLETPSTGGITYPYAIKAAAAFSNSSLSLSVSGNSPVTQSSGAVSVFPATRLNIGEYRVSGSNTGTINGHIKRIAYFPKRLANTELQALTS